MHVALAIVALTVFTYLNSDLTINPELLIFIFLSSITGYNFVKYAPLAKLHHRSLTQQLQQIQLFSFVVFIGLLASLFFIEIKVIIIGVLLGTVTLLYAIPIGRKTLREIALLKVFIIAFIWAFTTYILPFVIETFQWKNLIKLINFEFFERCIWVILLMIPFEIRDLRYDKKHLKTLVSSFGIRPVKIAAFIVLFLLLLEKFIVSTSEQFWLYSGIYFSLATVILLAKFIQKPYYSSFYVEALPIFWMILACF